MPQFGAGVVEKEGETCQTFQEAQSSLLGLVSGCVVHSLLPSSLEGEKSEPYPGQGGPPPPGAGEREQGLSMHYPHASQPSWGPLRTLISQQTHPQTSAGERRCFVSVD